MLFEGLAVEMHDELDLAPLIRFDWVHYACINTAPVQIYSDLKSEYYLENLLLSLDKHPTGIFGNSCISVA